MPVASRPVDRGEWPGVQVLRLRPGRGSATAVLQCCRCCQLPLIYLLLPVHSEVGDSWVRDVIVEKFDRLLRSGAATTERAMGFVGVKSYLHWGSIPADLTAVEVSHVAHLRQVLGRGIQVTSHLAGKTSKRILWFCNGVDAEGLTTGKLYIASSRRTSSKGTEKGLWLTDVAECRPGANSDSFSKVGDARGG